MEEKEKTFQEWEIEIKEQLAESDELKLITLVQENAKLLVHWITKFKGNLRTGRKHTNHDLEELHRKIGKVAVLLDVLQLRYGDCSDVELAYLQQIEAHLPD